MKVFSFQSVRQEWLWFSVCLAIFFHLQGAAAVPLKGSNGKVVDFAEIVSATPQVLNAKVQEGGPVIGVAWSMLDLEDLKTSNPPLYAAYEKSLNGETTTFDQPPAPKKMEVDVEGLTKASPGRYEVTTGDGRVAVQLPVVKPKGLLLVSWGQDGNAIRYIGNSRENTHFRRFMDEFQMALVSYKFPDAGRGSQNMLPSYVHAEKGSGKTVMDGIAKIGEEAGVSNLSELPMVVYGLDMPGAAFAFNFTHLFPERIVATIVAKGAFYSGSPTVESLKVPILFVWGEYNQDPDLWNPTHQLPEVMEKFRVEKPDWIDAMEPRAPRGETPLLNQFAFLFVGEMIKARLSEEGEFRELDRSQSWVGDLEAFTVSPIGDAEAPLKEGQTWLPSERVAKMWEKFTTGALELPGQ